MYQRKITTPGAAYPICPGFAAKFRYGLPCPTGESLDNVNGA
jgi:hypothetical protein